MRVGRIRKKLELRVGLFSVLAKYLLGDMYIEGLELCSKVPVKFQFETLQLVRGT